MPLNFSLFHERVQTDKTLEQHVSTENDLFCKKIYFFLFCDYISLPIEKCN